MRGRSLLRVWIAACACICCGSGRQSNDGAADTGGADTGGADQTFTDARDAGEGDRAEGADARDAGAADASPDASDGGGGDAADGPGDGPATDAGRNRWTPQVQTARVFSRTSGHTVPRWLQVASDGTIYAAGPLTSETTFYRTSLNDTSVVSAGYAAFLAKLAPDGTVLWVNGYGITAFSDASAWRPPALMPDGSIVLCGDHSPQHGDVPYVQRLDPSGQQVWLTEWTPGVTLPYVVGATPDGDLIGVGSYTITDPVIATSGPLVMKLSGASGAIVWTHLMTETDWQRPRAIVVPADGFPLVAGSDAVGSPYTLVRLSPDGVRAGAGTWIWSDRTRAIGDFAAVGSDRVAALTNGNGLRLTLLDRSSASVLLDQPLPADYLLMAAKGDWIAAVGLQLGTSIDLDPGLGVDSIRAMEFVTHWTGDGAYAGSIELPSKLLAQALTVDGQGAAVVALEMALHAGEQTPLGPGGGAPSFTAPADDQYVSILKLAP